MASYAPLFVSSFNLHLNSNKSSPCYTTDRFVLKEHYDDGLSELLLFFPKKFALVYAIKFYLWIWKIPAKRDPLIGNNVIVDHPKSDSHFRQGLAWNIFFLVQIRYCVGLILSLTSIKKRIKINQGQLIKAK